MSDVRFPCVRELNLASVFFTVVYSSYSAKAGNRRRFISRIHVQTEPTHIGVSLEQPRLSSTTNSMASFVTLATLTLPCRLPIRSWRAMFNNILTRLHRVRTRQPTLRF